MILKQKKLDKIIHHYIERYERNRKEPRKYETLNVSRKKMGNKVKT